MRGLKVLLNIGGWWAKRLTFLIGSLITMLGNKSDKFSNSKIRATNAPAIWCILIIKTLHPVDIVRPTTAL